MADASSTPRRRLALYRAGLRLLPSGFRRDYESALVEDAARTLAEHRGAAAIRATLALAFDLGWLLLRLWILAAARTLRLATSGRRRRDGRPTNPLPELCQASRAALRRPAVSLPVVGLLALGTAGAVLTWLLLSVVLLRPLPYPGGDRLVALFVHEVEQSSTRSPASPADFVGWKAELTELDSMTAAHPWAPVATGPEGPEQIPALRATAELFELLGVRPMLGSTFSADTVNDASEQVVVLRHDLWQRRYGGDRSIVGESLMLDGVPHTIVGVMPPGFLFPPFWASEAEMWAPLRLDAQELDSAARFLRVFARLGPGADRERVATRHRELAARLHAADPRRHAEDVNFETVEEVVASGARPTVILLFGASLLLLGLAAADVAILLLGRAAERERELEVRRALGASRSRLSRQWLFETGLLTLCGTGLGIVLALAGLRLLAPGARRWLPLTAADELSEALSLTGPAAVRLLPVISIALLAAVGLAGAYALIPALGSRSSRAARSRAEGTGRSRSVLLAFEAGLTVLLLAAGAFVTRSTWQLLRHDPGFRVADVHTVELSLAGSENQQRDRRGAFLEAVADLARRLPGVRAAGLVNHLPVGGDRWALGYRLDGEPELPASDLPRAVMRVADPGYAPTIGLRLTAGRWIEPSDRPDSERVLVVNRTLAQRAAPTGEPDGGAVLGRRLEAMGSWWRIVGVVEDADQDELSSEVIPEVYFPFTQDPTHWNKVTTVVVRSDLELGPVVRTLGDAVSELDPDAALARPRTMRQIVGDQTASRRLTVWILVVFAGAGGLLTATGLYAVLSLLAQQRRREVGIRLALGESHRQARRRLLGWGLRCVAAGVTVAAAAAIAGGRALATTPALGSLGLDTFRLADPLSLTLAIVVVATIAATAGWLSSRRLASVAPSDALRQE